MEGLRGRWRDRRGCGGACGGGLVAVELVAEGLVAEGRRAGGGEYTVTGIDEGLEIGRQSGAIARHRFSLPPLRPNQLCHPFFAHFLAFTT